MSKIKLYCIFLFATLVAYFGSVKYGFSQDDWYFLSISVAHNLGEVINFFNPWSQSGFAFYRPLGTQLYYYIFHHSFGLMQAPFRMHIFMLIIQSLSAYNVGRLTKKITKDHILSVLAGVIYATSSVHFLSLYYIAATQQLMAALFALLAINDFLENKNVRSAMWFALGLLSKEVAIVAPIVMILAEQRIVGKLNIKALFTRLIPVGLIGLIYVTLRFFGGLQVQSEYHFIFNVSVINTIRWYYLFGYGVPEELVRYGLPRMAINFYGFMNDFGWRGIITFVIPFIISIYVIIRSTLGLLNKTGLKPVDIAIDFVWWILSLAPILFLQDHRYPHYVDLALIPMILLVLEKTTTKIQILMAFLLIFVSLVSINLSELSHWTTKRAVDAAIISSNILNSGQCNLEEGVVFEGNKHDLLEISYAMSIANGPRVICQKPSLQVYYKELP